MQEEVILEIPQQDENQDSAEWQPPVLRKEPIPEKKLQSCADVFFVQYLICIILLTIIFSVKLWDEQSFQNVVNQFSEQIHKPSELWVLSLIEWVKQLWN